MNSFSINQSAAHIPHAIDPNEVALEVPRNLTEPNRAVSREEVVSQLNHLPVDNPPQSGIGLSSGSGIIRDEVQVNQPGGSSGVPVVISQPRRDQPLGMPVLTNNQLSERPSVRHDDSYEDFKSCCREYWQCVKTDDRCVQRARCMTFHGTSVGLTVASGGVYAVGLGVVYCCALFCMSGGNNGPQRNPCSPSMFSKSCFPDCCN
jgi:hypothetical protein